MPSSKRTLTLAAGSVVLLASVLVTVGIFQLRARSGDSFAPYSTYRADPLGLMAVYRALGTLPGVTVGQFLRPIEEMPEGPETTFVIAGAMLGPDPVPVLERIEAFALRGGRVVVAFAPIERGFYLDDFQEALKEATRPPSEDDEHVPDGDPDSLDEAPPDAALDHEVVPEEETPPAETTPNEEEPSEAPGEADWVPAVVDISDHWGFDYGFDAPGDGLVAERDAGAPDVEAAVAWRSGLYFEPGNDGWQPVYRQRPSLSDGARVLVMERTFGDGSIVLCSDTYFLSNEAARKDRAPAFLAWLVGTNTTILFSEIHLGTQQQDRIMTLVRQYRLHGVLFGFVVLGILFVWKNATTLVPRRGPSVVQTALPATDVERSHQDGLDNLLARFIDRDRLVETCIREWRQHFHNSPKAPSVAAVYASLRETGRRGPASVVAAYNRIVQEIQKR